MSGQSGIEISKIAQSVSHNRNEEKVEDTPQRVPAVEIHNLKKSYGLKPVLRGIDLVLHKGLSLAILGANGAGKTTLLRILAGLTQPGSGRVSIEGLDITQKTQQVRHLVGVVAHQPYLYEELTALENLLFFGRMYNVEQARERASELLRRVGLEKRAQERTGAFSRGQLQRLAWARALLHAPHLLLLDEPETGMDQQGSELIDTLLQEHRARGGSTIFTTHQLERALQQSDEVLFIRGGRTAYYNESGKLTVDELRRMYREVT